jgi:monothiol glutaredoxin
MNTEEKIRKQLADNPVILYMKGTPDKPACGFSARAVGLLKGTGTSFAWVNVLEAPFIMEKLPEVSDFPTFPQLFIHGEIIGGSDIIAELLARGELQALLTAGVH